MTFPANIVGFLDFFGEWKPALAFVMAGAVGVYAALYPLVLKRRAPLFEPDFDVPSAAAVDIRLLAGAAAFGVGWGIGGFCPGPSLVALGAGARDAIVFVSSMCAGIWLHRLALRGGAPQEESSGSCG